MEYTADGIIQHYVQAGLPSMQIRSIVHVLASLLADTYDRTLEQAPEAIGVEMVKNKAEAESLRQKLADAGIDLSTQVSIAAQILVRMT